MSYILSDKNTDSIPVPLIVFSRLAQLEDNWLRVALYVISHNNTDEAEIARELRLKNIQGVRDALKFWKGAGLICDNEDDNIVSPEPVTASITKLTTREVGLAARGDANIASLVQECQALTGGVITETDTNELVTLYLCDAMPIDMILMGVSHFAALGKRSGKYIARALRSWQADGITSADDVEKYLKLLETRTEREHNVAEIFGIKDAKFTRLESTKISEWYEGFGYDESMIAEAVGYVGNAENKTIRYVNGILRKWYTNGYKNVHDVQASSNMTMQNVQSTGKMPTRDILQNALGKVPVYKPRQER